MSLPSDRRSLVISENVLLGPLTTYKSGGPARFLAEVASDEGLDELARSGLGENLPVLVIGRGSNLVVADRGFPGVVVKLGDGFGTIAFGEGTVTAGAATTLPKLARAVTDASMTGLEFFVGIPGSVGGGVRQNAGCFGEETRDHLVVATIFDLADMSVSDRGPDELEMSYRHSNVSSRQVVTRASFRIREGDPVRSRSLLKEITRWRKEHQPGGTFNAGSVFKNPPGEAAGEIIDRLGLKGLSVGGVSVSQKHANFFVADASARSSDIAALVRLVKDRVFEATGTILEPEIQFVGFEP
jgi:UDP-N-acetylmuramate dehydrogenase